MSIKAIENEIRRFLSSADPEVICIRGRWGVGKTFAWNRYLEDARTAGEIGLKRYSYVSLFGLTSLDDFKFSIFENSVPSDERAGPTLKTLKSNAIGVAEQLGRRTVWFAQQLPWVKNHIGGLGPLWFSSVKATIVCVDDFERRGDRLAVRDVLGLVSNLKEQKGCKVVLILNDEALADDKQDFEKYLEKVVDANLRFAPSASECVQIALSATGTTNALLSENCVTLGISNIRVIKKIERAITQVEPSLRALDEGVLRQAVQSLALLGWSVFEPKLAPPLEYLERRGGDFLGTSKRDKVPEKEAAWNALLGSYHWQAMDDLDRVLLDGIQNGFFDLLQLRKHADELHQQLTAFKSNSAFRDSWRMFHESFEDNDQRVIEAVYHAFLDTIQYRSTLDLNGTVWLLKELGSPALAQSAIEQYVAIGGQGKAFFDLDRNPFKERIDDPDVIQAFGSKFAALRDEHDPALTLQSMARRHGWNDEDLNALSSLPVDDYYKIIKESEGQTMLDMIEACLQFDRIVNATPPMREIARRAKEALKRIGQESRINALRVRRYGVDAATVIDDDDSRHQT